MGNSAGSQPKPKTFLREVLDRFAKKAAISVMVRATMENVLAPEPLDEMFGRVAERQYTRQLLFSTLVALMAVVVCRVRKSAHAGLPVIEQEVLVSDPEQRALHLRRITVHLNGYTRDGDREIHLLTNLAPEISATAIADAYRDRWRIEGLFAELERNLDAEIDTLGYPKAALFAFAVALLAYNVLSTAKAAIRAHRGAETIEEGLSTYDVADELSGTHRGIMTAVLDEEWRVFASFTPGQLAALLVQRAANIDLRRFTKKRCGPRGPRLARLRFRNRQHVSVFRLLLGEAKRRIKPSDACYHMDIMEECSTVEHLERVAEYVFDLSATKAPAPLLRFVVDAGVGATIAWSWAQPELMSE